MKAYWKTAQMNLKREVYSHYTPVEESGRHVPHCAKCGEDNINVLELHHKANNGREERKRYGTGSKYLRSLKARGYPQGIDILCSNCHGKIKAST